VSRYDAVVVGSGHNGLVCASYLAKRGAKVLVLEKRPIIGGACVTEEPWPGFKINTYSYVCGLLRESIVEELELKKFGYQPILYDPQYFLPFPDKKHIFIWIDMKKTVKEIERYSKKDARAYPRYVEFWENMLQLIEPAMMAPAVPVKDLLSMFEGPEAEDLLRKLLLVSAQDFLDEWFESDELKAVLCTQAVIGTFAGPRTPGTAYVLAHHSIGTLDGEHEVWGFSKGGMGVITTAMARAARHFGAEIRLNSSVRRILVREGKVTGVETASGERIEANVVASGTDANVTFNKLVGPENIPEDFVEKINKIKYRGAALKFNAALKELPNFKALPGSLGPQHRGTADITVSMDYVERAFDDAKYGEFSKHPFIEMVFQSAVDPTVAPPGKHTMTCFVQYVPQSFSKGTWKQNKPKVAETIISTIEEFAPNIRKALLHYQVLGPEDFERDLGLTGGSIFQGDITPDQLFSFRPIPGWSHYRTPVEGLYLCGSAAHPGGGVVGAPGYLAASTILEDVKSGLGRY
jgi:phytoene dehydrogenase-like protein